MRVVLDTNVYISSLINPSGTPSKVWHLVLDGQISGCITNHLWEELKDVLSRPKIRHVLLKNQNSIVVDIIIDSPHSIFSFIPEFQPEKNWIPDDEDDNWVIQCALTAKAAYIISGDRDFADLGGQVEGIPIVTPTEFLQRFADVIPK